MTLIIPKFTSSFYSHFVYIWFSLFLKRTSGHITNPPSKINFHGSPLLHDLNINPSMLAFKNFPSLSFKSLLSYSLRHCTETGQLNFQRIYCMFLLTYFCLYSLSPRIMSSIYWDPILFKAHLSNVTSVSNLMICSEVPLWVFFFVCLFLPYSILYACVTCHLG